MIKNFFKIAIRNFLKNKAYTFINLFGLIVGVLSVSLILLWIQFELSYDRHFKDHEQVYRLTQHGEMGGKQFDIASVSAQWIPTLINEYPAISSGTRVLTLDSEIIYVDNKAYVNDRICFADSTFFNIFKLDILSGESSIILRNPGTVAISKSTAAKYFGEMNPVGELIKFENNDYDQTTNIFHIEAVYDDLPENSHFHFDFIFSISSVQETKDPTWFAANYHSYLKIVKPEDADFIESKLVNIYAKYAGPIAKEKFGRDINDFLSNNVFFLKLTNIADIHLYCDYLGEIEENGNRKVLYIFLSIALFILLIASINFINITSSHYYNRFKEVGIRKTLGANRKEIIIQFLMETYLLVIIAVNFALILAQQSLPILNKYTGINLNLVKLSLGHLGIVLVFILIIGFIAAIYPTIVLSAFNPQTLFLKQSNSAKKKINVKGSSVIIQFILSIILIIGMITTKSQINYLFEKDLGYKKENILLIKNAWQLGEKTHVLKERLAAYPEFESVSMSGYLPTPSDRSSMNIFRDGEKDDNLKTEVEIWEVDGSYFSTLGIELREGRFFSNDDVNSNHIIINEAAVRHFQLSSPIGRILSTFNDVGTTDDYKVVGVVKDFHFSSLKHLVEPLVLKYSTQPSNIIVKLKTKTGEDKIDMIKGIWAEFTTNVPFEYEYLDDSYSNIYQKEISQNRLIVIFTLLAIFIAVLGLYGLITYTLQKRVKEIGIRKAHGAKSNDILFMILYQYLKWIMLAFIIASSIGWYIMKGWLQNFSYHIKLTWYIFIIAGLIAAIICLITILYNVYKASRMNVVNSLRYE